MLTVPPPQPRRRPAVLAVAALAALFLAGGALTPSRAAAEDDGTAADENAAAGKAAITAFYQIVDTLQKTQTAQNAYYGQVGAAYKAKSNGESSGPSGLDRAGTDAAIGEVGSLQDPVQNNMLDAGSAFVTGDVKNQTEIDALMAKDGAKHKTAAAMQSSALLMSVLGQAGKALGAAASANAKHAFKSKPAVDEGDERL